MNIAITGASGFIGKNLINIKDRKWKKVSGQIMLDI